MGKPEIVFPRLYSGSLEEPGFRPVVSKKMGVPARIIMGQNKHRILSGQCDINLDRSWVKECKLKKVVVTNIEYEVGTD